MSLNKDTMIMRHRYAMRISRVIQKFKESIQNVKR